MYIKKYIQLKGFCLFLFIILIYSDGLAQAGLNENGKLDVNAGNVVDKYGAKGSGFARTIHGQQFSKPLGFSAICDGTQPTTVVAITSSTGKIWMDRNLGASRAATSATDFAAFGCLYQWGRGNDGHASMLWTSATEGTPVNGTTTEQLTTGSPASNLFVVWNADWLNPEVNTLWQGVTGTNNPCPAGYRVPTLAELNSERNLGHLNYGPTLKAPQSPHRSYDGSLAQRQKFWTATFADFSSAELLGRLDGGTDFRAAGLTVRCIKN